MRGPHHPSKTLSATGALVASMVSLTLGNAFAETLFAAVRPEGTAALRLAFGAALLCALRRPWRGRLSPAQLGAVALYGATLGAMNLCFYLAIDRLPLGLAIAIEFLGPLTIAVAASRRALDLFWIGLAMAGLALLLPAPGGAERLDPVGIGFALAAANCWALYIVFGQRAGHVPGSQAVPLGLAVGALVVLPFGIARAGTALLQPAILLPALAIAVLSSALPYTLEMVALRELPRRTFGILLSLEPAIGALIALAVLGERLAPLQWIAVASIVAASIGTVATARGGASG